MILFWLLGNILGLLARIIARTLLLLLRHPKLLAALAAFGLALWLTAPLAGTLTTGPRTTIGLLAAALVAAVVVRAVISDHRYDAELARARHLEHTTEPSVPRETDDPLAAPAGRWWENDREAP